MKPKYECGRCRHFIEAEKSHEHKAVCPGFNPFPREKLSLWQLTQSPPREAEDIHAAMVAASNPARRCSDEELRAECERRFPKGFGVVHEVTLRERDEWKRRAEAAEAKVAFYYPFAPPAPTPPQHNKAQWMAQQTPTQARPAEESWPCDEDLLADDSE